ncbi:hypothetical protein ACOME3_003565 [Neoechinorhynchus agilis]
MLISDNFSPSSILSDISIAIMQNQQNPSTCRETGKGSPNQKPVIRRSSSVPCIINGRMNSQHQQNTQIWNNLRENRKAQSVDKLLEFMKMANVAENGSSRDVFLSAYIEGVFNRSKVLLERNLAGDGECRMTIAEVEAEKTLGRAQEKEIEQSGTEILPPQNMEPLASLSNDQIFEDGPIVQVQAEESTNILKSILHTKKNGTKKKKVVRFADSLGLDLAVVTYFDKYSVTINDKTLPGSSSTSTEHTEGSGYVSFFQNPGYEIGFKERLERQRVCLLEANTFQSSITGIIAVMDDERAAYHKRVFVRITTDGWTSFRNVEATYKENSYDGRTSKFSFSIYLGRSPSCVEFAICYCSPANLKPELGSWDNNNGTNYRFSQFYSGHRRYQSDETPSQSRDRQAASSRYGGNLVGISSYGSSRGFTYWLD